MENLITRDMVERNEPLLKGRIFTELQLNILKKKLQKKPLDINERTYYYKFIKPKVRAMLSFFNINENINGRDNIIKERIPRAISALKSLEKKHKNKKIMVSGSFLFNKKYKDIDIFVFTKYDKEDYTKGRIHVNFLNESALESLFFSSLSQISVSNFSYAAKTDFDIRLSDILQTYELLINAILNHEDYRKNIRDFLLQTEYKARGVILNPRQLYHLKEKITRKSIGILSDTFINALLLSYKKMALKRKLKDQIKGYKHLLEEYKNAKNLGIYINTYKEAIELAA